jgi:hypothetical protein
MESVVCVGIATLLSVVDVCEAAAPAAGGDCAILFLLAAGDSWEACLSDLTRVSSKTKPPSSKERIAGMAQPAVTKKHTRWSDDGDACVESTVPVQSGPLRIRDVRVKGNESTGAKSQQVKTSTQSSAAPPGKTGHADEAFVIAVFETLAQIFECSVEDLITDYCFHNTTSTCCRNSDGTLSIQAVTRVGLSQAVRAWFGKWEMSFKHSSVHANSFTLDRKTEDSRLGKTCLAFGVHKLSGLAKEVLYRRRKKGTS